jgi:hypothetical protein
MKFLVAGYCCVLALVAFSQAQRTSPSAQASSRAGKKGNSSPSDVATAPDDGNIADGVYRTPFFALSYKIPFGWVDRTAEMQEDNEPGKSIVLLAVFEKPPEAKTEGLNPAVVIAAESISSYPDLKTAADYFGPLSEAALSRGFKVANEPYEFPSAGKQVAREDFTKEKAYQSSLVWLHKGYIVSATFIGAGEDDVDELIVGLKLGTAARPR